VYTGHEYVILSTYFDNGEYQEVEVGSGPTCCGGGGLGKKGALKGLSSPLRDHERRVLLRPARQQGAGSALRARLVAGGHGALPGHAGGAPGAAARLAQLHHARAGQRPGARLGSERELAIAASIANSLGAGGFAVLAQQAGWTAERALLIYARMSAHKERRRQRLNSIFPPSPGAGPRA